MSDKVSQVESAVNVLVPDEGATVTEVETPIRVTEPAEPPSGLVQEPLGDDGAVNPTGDKEVSVDNEGFNILPIPTCARLIWPCLF